MLLVITTLFAWLLPDQHFSLKSFSVQKLLEDHILHLLRWSHVTTFKSHIFFLYAFVYVFNKKMSIKLLVKAIY